MTKPAIECKINDISITVFTFVLDKYMFEEKIMLLDIILMVALTVFGSFLYRWRGMNSNDVPAILRSRQMRRISVGLVIGVSVWVMLTNVASLEMLWIIPLVTVLTFIGIIIGHGSYFPRNDGSVNEDNEVFAFLTKLIANPLNERARFIGMALTGIAVTLPAAIGVYIALMLMYDVVSTVAIIALVLFALSGLLKAVAYWKTPDTERGEFATGAIFAGAAPVINVIMSLFT